MKFDNFILNEKLLLESKDDKGLFKAVFFMGCPGAGKSYVGSKIYGGDISPRVVNVDKFIDFYISSAKGNLEDKGFDKKEIDKLIDKEEISFMQYPRSKTLTINQFVSYIGSALPLFCDTTGADIQRVKGRVRSLELLGYDLAYVFINTSLETSLYRASLRSRPVPPEVIESDYHEIQRVKPQLKSLFSFGIEINNNEGELTDNIINKAYKKISYFFSGDIQNPIGKEYYQLMQDNNWDYLAPNILSLGEIKSKLARWFVSN